MSIKNSLGDRMKAFENSFKSSLPPRMPVILRVDGKAFHTYTRECEKPFDDRLNQVMNLTAIKLCEEIQGAQVAYIQSDEISILIHGYKKFNSSSWFDNEIQKMVSVSAAIASGTFTDNSWKIWSNNETFKKNQKERFVSFYRPAFFDSRVFILPEEEVCNYFVWRLKDCIRNSISMYARAYFSNKELYRKSSNDIKEMLKTIGHDWDLLPNNLKNGRVIFKRENEQGRKKWIIENDFPLFWEERNFIEKFLKTEE